MFLIVSVATTNEEQGFVLGVGFDNENVLAAVMDLRPRIRSTVKEFTRLDQGPHGLVNQLLSCAREATRQAQVPLELLLGIGVAGSGLVDSRKGSVVMSTTIEFLRDLPLQQIFEKEFGLPALVENITRAKTVAERPVGAAAAAEDMIYVEYGKTGIRAGIVSGGKLVLGCECAAGEFGHTRITEKGPACKCGSFGCLEAIAGSCGTGSKNPKGDCRRSPLRGPGAGRRRTRPLWMDCVGGREDGRQDLYRDRRAGGGLSGSWPRQSG